MFLSYQQSADEHTNTLHQTTIWPVYKNGILKSVRRLTSKDLCYKFIYLFPLIFEYTTDRCSRWPSACAFLPDVTLIRQLQTVKVHIKTMTGVFNIGWWTKAGVTVGRSPLQFWVLVEMRWGFSHNDNIPGNHSDIFLGYDTTSPSNI